MNHVFRSLSVGTRQWTPTLCRRSLSQSCRPAIKYRNQNVQILQSRRTFWSRWLGENKTPQQPVDPSAPKFIYPEYLCLYSAGKRIIWVGCMKLATTYPFLLTVFYVSPNIEQAWPSLMQYGFVAENPTLTGVIICLLSLIPTGMFYLAAPYVTHIFIKLPPFARVSKLAAMSWAATNLSSSPSSTNAKLRIFTMMWLGRPKYVEAPLKELMFCRKRLGCVNMQWKWTGKEKPRVTEFYVEKSKGPGKKGHDIFYEVMARIEQQTTPGGTGKTVVGDTKAAVADASAGTAAAAPVVKKPLAKMGRKGYKK